MLRGQLIARTERGAELERGFANLLRDVEVVCRLQVCGIGVRVVAVVVVVGGTRGQDEAGEGDEGEEEGYDEPYAICDAEGALVEARGGLFVGGGNHGGVEAGCRWSNVC